MTTPTVAPFVLKDVTFLVALDNYEAHLSQVQLDPSVQTLAWQGLTPSASFSDTSSPSWAATLAYAQDWKTPNSFSQYLYDHQGETVAATLTTNPGAGSWAVNLIINPGAVGGQVNAYAVATVTLGISGQPVFTPPVLARATDDTDDTDDERVDAS
jgi:hypothetical protein